MPKQGLKPITITACAVDEYIRMQDPLKQGLKQPDKPIHGDPRSTIRMQDPLKQGLKPLRNIKSDMCPRKFECKIH